MSKVKYTDRKLLQASLQENNRNVCMLFNEALIELSSLSLVTMNIYSFMLQLRKLMDMALTYLSIRIAMAQGPKYTFSKMV